LPDQSSTFGTYRPRGLVARLVSITRSSSTHWIGRRCAYLFRALGILLLRGKPVDIEANGSRMRLYPARNNAEKKLAFTPHYFDADERDFLLSVLGEDPVFIDVGADVGGYALFVAAHTGPRARILAVEPQPDIFERLIYNIRENGFSAVKALDCAVSDVDGSITLFVNPLNQGETSMRLVDAHRKARHLKVQARTLAGLLRDERMTHVDILKLDVEGAEDLILEPFFRDVPQALWPKILIVEDSPARWGVDLGRLLRDCGYTVVKRTAANLIYRRG
jgi:FkbM family methyltransferase